VGTSDFDAQMKTNIAALRAIGEVVYGQKP
jgi:hypothetical protein